MAIEFMDTYPLPKIGEMVPPDEIIKLQCLEFASRKSEGSFILDSAKEMYQWVKEKSDSK